MINDLTKIAIIKLFAKCNQIFDFIKLLVTQTRQWVNSSTFSDRAHFIILSWASREQVWSHPWGGPYSYLRQFLCHQRQGEQVNQNQWVLVVSRLGWDWSKSVSVSCVKIGGLLISTLSFLLGHLWLGWDQDDVIIIISQKLLREDMLTTSFGLLLGSLLFWQASRSKWNISKSNVILPALLQ